MVVKPSNIIKSATPGYLKVYHPVLTIKLNENPISATVIALSTQGDTGFKKLPKLLGV